VLGFDAVATVGDSASAMWGPATIAEPIPMVLSSSCQSQCPYWYDADPDDAIPTSPTFGFVHLAAWRARGGAQGPCPAQASALPHWIRGTQVVEVPLGDPPAFACAVRGSGDWQDAILEQVGSSRALVINNPDQMIAGHYAAVGFTPLVIQNLSQGVGESRVECARLDRDLETDQVIDLAAEVLGCLLTEGVSSVEIEVLPDDLDYEYNPVTHTFRWLDEVTENVTIIVWGIRAAEGGDCGEPVPIEDGEESWCLTVSFDGPKVGGREPDPSGSVSDYGLRAIRLTRLTGDE